MRIKTKIKNALQAIKGMKRVINAIRDKKGKFIKRNKGEEMVVKSPAEYPAESPAGNPAKYPAESPAQHPAQTSSLYITTSNLDKIGPRQDRTIKKTPFMANVFFCELQVVGSYFRNLNGVLHSCSMGSILIATHAMAHAKALSRDETLKLKTVVPHILNRWGELSYFMTVKWLSTA